MRWILNWERFAIFSVPKVPVQLHKPTFELSSDCFDYIDPPLSLLYLQFLNKVLIILPSQFSHPSTTSWISTITDAGSLFLIFKFLFLFHVFLNSCCIYNTLLDFTSNFLSSSRRLGLFSHYNWWWSSSIEIFLIFNPFFSDFFGKDCDISFFLIQILILLIL